MKYTLNPVVLVTIQTLTGQIRDELAAVEARRMELRSELTAAETTLESLWSRMPADCRLPSVSASWSDALVEPREPSHLRNQDRTNGVGVVKTNGDGRTWVQDRVATNGSAQNGSVPNGLSDPEPSRSDDQPQQRRKMRMARPVDYVGTEVFRHRIIRIAEATKDGLMNATQVAEKLIADEQSQSTKSNLRGTILNHFRKHDDYEYIGPGTYQYLPMVGRDAPEG